jgi:nucleoside phosphorylase
MQLICAAVIEELEPLLQSANFKQEATALFIHQQKPIVLAALGVGLVDFSSAFQVLLNRYQIEKALLTGTCGVYPEASRQWPIGTLVAPSKISLGDLSAVEKHGYFPAPIVTTCHLDENFSQYLMPDSGTHCLTLTTITSDDPTAARIESYYRSHFEQMEAYAFARICQLQEISGAVLFAVANQVGRDGHQQWLNHAQQGAHQSAINLREKLQLV